MTNLRDDFDLACPSCGQADELIIEINDENLKPTDDALVEIRLYDHNNSDEQRYVDRVYNSLKDNAKVDESSDPIVCSVPEVPFVVPRGKYNTSFTEKTIKLHGASYNYTISTKC